MPLEYERVGKIDVGRLPWRPASAFELATLLLDVATQWLVEPRRVVEDGVRAIVWLDYDGCWVGVAMDKAAASVKVWHQCVDGRRG